MTNVVVIGGTGLIGSKAVARLAEHGHKATDALTLDPRFGDWLVQTAPRK